MVTGSGRITCLMFLYKVVRKYKLKKDGYPSLKDTKEL